MSFTYSAETIQVTLAAIAAVFVARGGRAARYAALPIFVAFAAQSILTSTFTNPWFWGLPPLAYAVPSLCYP